MLRPKKVGSLPVNGGTELKQTNEIATVIPLLNTIDNIEGKDITADALLTQRKLAIYLVEERKAHYHLTVKDNQPNLRGDIALFFQNRQPTPDFIEVTPPDHGRIETRKIWTTTALNDYLDFPTIGQACCIERETLNKKTGKQTHEVVYTITRRPEREADAKRLLKINREHWSIENKCHYVIDWNYDEDRGRIRTGHGPENITRLRRFAIGLIKSKGPVESVAQTMRDLAQKTRLVFDYLRMTRNSCVADMA